MLLERGRLAPIVLVNPLECFANEQTQSVDHLVHLDLRTIPRVDPVHAVDGDAGALAVNIVDEKFADKNGRVGVAFAYARDHFFGADGDFGYSWDGEGLEVEISEAGRSLKMMRYGRGGRRSLCRKERSRDIRRGPAILVAIRYVVFWKLTS
jgi:hypothetical protein